MELADTQYEQLCYYMASPEQQKKFREQEVRASQPSCFGETYEGHLIEVTLVCSHLKYGRLQVAVHTPNGKIVRPILNTKSGNTIKPNSKNPQSTVDWVIKRTKKFIDESVTTGVYTHCF